jgi:1,4-alpha-glucan branching enzyme
MGLAAAAVASVFLLPRPEAPPVPAAAGTTASPVVYVQFVLDAPGARSVSVGGDFDGWNGSFALEDPDGDGVWTGRAPVEPGLHSYMFLLDGSRWVTDPEASRYNDDGFGNRNAVLAVAAPTT